MDQKLKILQRALENVHQVQQLTIRIELDGSLAKPQYGYNTVNQQASMHAATPRPSQPLGPRKPMAPLPEGGSMAPSQHGMFNCLLSCLARGSPHCDVPGFPMVLSVHLCGVLPVAPSSPFRPLTVLAFVGSPFPQGRLNRHSML